VSEEAIEKELGRRRALDHTRKSRKRKEVSLMEARVAKKVLECSKYSRFELCDSKIG
jgi:hypothetical protein